MVIFYKVQVLICLIIYFILFGITSGKHQIKLCEDWKTVTFSTDDVKIGNDGFITVNDKKYPKNITYEMGNKTNVCICLMKQCLRKCCPLGQSIDSKGSCNRSQNQFTVESIKYYELQDSKIKEFITDSDHFALVNTNDIMLNCEPYALDQKSDSYYVLFNGNLIYRSKINDPYQTITIDNYCLEYFDEVRSIVPIVCPELETVSSAASSMSQPIISSKYLKQIRLTIYPVAIFTSLPFLMATFITYCIISEYRNMTGKSLLSQVGSIFTALMILGILMLNGSKVPTSACIILGTLFWSCQWILSNI